MIPILLAATLLLPQTAPAPERVLFDFEGGSYAGWTFTGDCWDKAPATLETFLDESKRPLVNGIVGKGYMTSLFKSQATTGTATSSDFTIDRHFLGFKIGGGKYPDVACVNLVVDGKVERTATGNDTADLRTICWDVSKLAGKTAHLEVVDKLKSPNRGYIMADYFTLLDRSPITGEVLPETYPEIVIPLRVVVIKDANGQLELFGKASVPFSIGEASSLVARSNEIFRQARMRFTLDPADFETRTDPFLYLDLDPPSPGVTTTNPDAKPPDTGRSERLALFRSMADARPDRITIAVHRGSEWRWDAKRQEWLYGVGFSHGGSPSIKGRNGTAARLSSFEPRVWAHELAHTFGLPHTSKDGVDNPSKVVTMEQIADAFLQYVSKGGDAKNPEYAIDGDVKAGVFDTPPDPGLGFWGSSNDLVRRISVRFGGEFRWIVVSRNNLMAASPRTTVLTWDQCIVMRKRAESWLAANGLKAQPP